MDIKEQIKPISYLKTHITQIVRSFDAGQDEPIIITQNGEEKMVLLSMGAYQKIKMHIQQTQEQHAFMKLIVMGDREISQGQLVSEVEFLGRLRTDE